MEAFTDTFNEIFGLINQMSPYLLLGFLLAGLMHAFIPRNFYSSYLAPGSFRSVFFAALFGVPLPLCSCGVIPTAMSLRREGASKGATVSFLIATPQTGIDSIIATYSLLGLPFAVIRPIAAFATALFGGQMVNFSDKEKPVQAPTCHASHVQNEVSLRFTDKIRSALRFAFVEMMEDIGKWLIIGLVVAGMITVLVPDSFFAVFRGNTLLSILLVLCIAIPMYVCATGSIPIAVALMLKGLTPGAALVLLMAGPACNAASILVINKVLGRRTLIAYIVSIIAGAILFGIGIDLLLPSSWFVPTVLSETHSHGTFMSWFSIGCTVILLLLLAHAAWHHCRHLHCHDDDNETCKCHRGE